MSPMDLAELLSQVDEHRLEDHVRRLEGPRHPQRDPAALAAAEELIADELSRASLTVERQPFSFRGVGYHNVVGTLNGAQPDLPGLLVGAHFDTVAHSPGADDNASGVAVLLEAARLAARMKVLRQVQFVGFNLEEPQDMLGTYRVGSTHFAREARRAGHRYLGALVLEMVGYTDERSGGQQVPPLVFKRVPDTGTFLAAVGDGRSRRLLRSFEDAARQHVPALEIVTYQTHLRGWTLPLTRLSDNASFWDRRYPALMISDTAFLRNPHYHQLSDLAETLDFSFMKQVTQAVVAAINALGRG
ncbi:MAG: M28 family peptidase [Gemmatimonadota bacterium]|nr:MAG: M28 family peptidase [Gemmatimonadota bacterium]